MAYIEQILRSLFFFILSTCYQPFAIDFSFFIFNFSFLIEKLLTFYYFCAIY